MSDHPQLPAELQHEVMNLVELTRQRSGWPARRTLATLEIGAGTYYRWRHHNRGVGGEAPARRGSLYELLAFERQAILDYARTHPAVRHRELAWKMVDEGLCGVSPSSVYRVLREANLVCRWKPKPKVKGLGRDAHPASRPDHKWPTDIKYVRVNQRNFYLLSFMDVYSRYIVHHCLLRRMDGLSVSIEAAAALATLEGDVRPDIQSDHGSGFIARDFVETLSASGLTHTKIRPHTPTDNAEIERYHRTIGEQIEEHELQDFAQARTVIAGIIEAYNTIRLRSALSFLRPADYYRGDPETLLATRRRRLKVARELRKQENIKLRQRLIPWPDDKTTPYPKRQIVSL